MDNAAKTLLVAAAAIALLGCETEDPQPPDPNTPLEPVLCDEDAPLSLIRTAPDSQLGSPPWLQICNVCPAAFDIAVADVELRTAWSDAGTCAIGMPTEPWPAVDSYSVSVRVDNGSRSAIFDFDHPGTGGRGDDLADLGSGTYKLPLAAANLRVPDVGFEPEGGDLLIHFEPTADHGYAVHLGRAEGSSNQQDLCVPTGTLSTTARLDRRQIAAPLEAGDLLPIPLSAPVLSGALQATLSSTGSALTATALMLQIDASLLEGDAESICADYEATAGTPLCGPCGDPAGEPDGNTCLSFVWEWGTAIRVPNALVHVDAPAPDCADPS
jgi:hypothetical protein